MWEVIHQLSIENGITSWNVRNLQKNDRGKRRGCCCCRCCCCCCCYDQIKRIAATINYTSVKLFPISLGHRRIVGLEFKFGRLKFFSEIGKKLLLNLKTLIIELLLFWEQEKLTIKVINIFVKLNNFLLWITNFKF